MPATIDPRMLVAYPLDETGSLAVRKSVGSAAYNLAPETSTGGQGVPTVSDIVSGRAVNLLNAQAGLTTASRRLIGSYAAWNVHPLYIPLPRATGQSGLALGARFNYQGNTLSVGTNGKRQGLAAFNQSTTLGGHMGFTVMPNASLRGRLEVTMPDKTIETVEGWTDTDGLLTDFSGGYALRGGWWRATLRYYNITGTTYGMQVVLYNEATGRRYRMTRSSTTMDYSSPTDSVAFCIGTKVTASDDSFQGYVDDVWLLNGDLSEENAVDLSRGGLKQPRQADATYRALPRYFLEARYADEAGVERTTRPVLVDGNLLARVSISPRAGAEAFSIRVRGFAPGRPLSPKWAGPIYIQKAGSRSRQGSQR